MFSQIFFSANFLFGNLLRNHKIIFPFILQHRLVLSVETEMEGHSAELICKKLVEK